MKKWFGEIENNILADML